MRGLAIAFLVFDSAVKVLQLGPALEASAQIGWAVDSVFTIGVIEATCVLLYIVPQTAVLGALLLTGYLGGAIATHLRIGSPMFTHVLFPTYIAALVWGGLYVRDARLRALLPFYRS